MNTKLLKEENILKMKNKQIHFKTLQKISEIRTKKENTGYINFNSYEINKILEEIFGVLKKFDELINSIDDIELTFIDRNKFDADICIKLPLLLQKYKKEYKFEIIPNIVKLLEKSYLKTDGIISSISIVGIYINISFGDKFLFNTLNDVFKKGKRYGENDSHKGESIVVDYSSPNVAKHLHAGHIRSTIIGHILSNLYDANGYYTFRVNHINDWGGFGYLIEGYYRWNKILNYFENKNDMLFHIYKTYRKGEKISNDIEEYNSLKKENIEELKLYYGTFANYEEFSVLFKNFVESGKIRFNNLENGKETEVNIWEKMVKWSLEDFNIFYNLLGIHQDYVLGESFYSDFGVNLVFELEKIGKVLLYTQEHANDDINELNGLLKNGEITQKSFDIIKEEIQRDISAYVIKLDNFERFVVLKSDKSSIYATRDLGAIKYRFENFSPSRIVYEVGQEQAEHFDKLFKSAEKIGINGVKFSHVYHGFYVDSKTKKKLSSRDGASNVYNLITESINFFKKKYNNSNFSEIEIDDISYKLAIGSIIFNDIKADKKNPVLISNNIEETCQTFEESGGAYVMYSIVRAKSILGKIGNLISMDFDNINIEKLDIIEKIIINEINKFPLIIKIAQENDNPATLVDYILNLSRFYNSYYNSHRVIVGDEIIKSRVFITKAFIIVSSNAMKVCHIEIPDKL